MSPEPKRTQIEPKENPNLPTEEKMRRKKEKKPAYHPEARTILTFLNEAAGFRYREVDSNLKVISARLNEVDVTVDGVKKMILRQCQRWKGTEREVYLRPETLFRASKFDAYYASRELELNLNGHHTPESNQIQEKIEVRSL